MMYKMVDVTMSAYDEFRKKIVSEKKKKGLRFNDRPSGSTIIDRDNGKTICSEMHLLGKNRYLINSDYLEDEENEV